jgi:hypothetical protein
MLVAPMSSASGLGGAQLPGRPNIVIVSSIGFVVRNYLLGSCLSRLREESNVTVFSPLAAEGSFREAMGRRGAAAVPLKNPLIGPSWRRVRSVRQAFHAAWLDNETWRIKRTADKQVAAGGRAGWLSRLRGSIIFSAACTLTGPRVLQRFDKSECEHALRSPEADYYRRWFDKIRPSLIFSPAPLMTEEWLPIQVAHALGITTALSVLSWDNLSSKGRLPLPCSAVLVWNERMERELLASYPALSPEQVHITGAPQFDFYRREDFWESREAFLRRLGGDPSRPLLLYAGVTPALMPREHEVVERLAEALRAGAVRGCPQLLVRLHPKDDGRRYEELRRRYPEVLFTVPGRRHGGRLKEWQPDVEDVRVLVNTVRHSDVHINVASTMTVDAAVVDRPVINVTYDLRPPGDLSSWGVRIYDATHYLPIPKTGGVRLARTPEELVGHINTYLDNPALDRQGRRRIVELVCGNVDGRSGDRVAAKLLELAGARPHLNEAEAGRG